MPSDDDKRDGHEFLATAIAEDAEPGLALALTKGRSTKVNSEEAHKIAAQAAREQDRKNDGR